MLRRIGNTAIELSPIGLGTWQFAGDSGKLSKFWSTLSPADCNAIVAAAIENGINWFDTAEAYGDGNSENCLANALLNGGYDQAGIHIATKWWPRGQTASQLLSRFQTSQENLSNLPISLYQIHHPDSLSSLDEEIDALTQLVEDKLVLAVGLCNYSADQIHRACELATRNGIEISTVQSRYSLFNRSIELDGVLAAAKENGLKLIAWSPLEQGLLTGKFHRNQDSLNKLQSARLETLGTDSTKLQQTKNLITKIEEIAKANEVSTSQIALNWLVNSHDDLVLAIPGASSAEQVVENAGAMKINIADKDRESLDEFSRPTLLRRIKSGIKRVIRKSSSR